MIWDKHGYPEDLEAAAADALLYPLAIPSQFRERPKKKAKDFVMSGRPLPFKVLSLLGGLEQATDLRQGANRWNDYNRVKVDGCYDMRMPHEVDKHAWKEARRILESLGGTPVAGNDGRWAFDYNPLEVVKEIVASGCLPDQKAHQFYPTPEKLARIAVDFAMQNAEEWMTWLEPSAGLGGLADLMPKDQTACIEISRLHCKVLEAKKHYVTCADFLATNSDQKFDRIVMNPPFSEGRWNMHVTEAVRRLQDGGRLVAILPASAARNNFDGVRCEWHGPYHNEFAGTSVSVVILVANKE